MGLFLFRHSRWLMPFCNIKVPCWTGTEFTPHPNPAKELGEAAESPPHPAWPLPSGVKGSRCSRCFPGGLDGKESACAMGDPGSIPESGRSPREGNGHPLQYSCLENPHGQRSLVGQIVHGVAKSQTRLNDSQVHSAVSLLRRRMFGDNCPGPLATLAG